MAKEGPTQPPPAARRKRGSATAGKPVGAKPLAAAKRATAGKPAAAKRAAAAKRPAAARRPAAAKRPAAKPAAAGAPRTPGRTSAAAAAGDESPAEPFPIVGVGASAGGLEAFSQMLSALPVDTGMAFVLVQHLSPSHASLLAEILSRTTKMPVMEVHDEPRVMPNHVYVIPPDRNMELTGGGLHLLPRQLVRGQHRPIDLFLLSLAAAQKHRAIGVILSGTATDGTLGLKEIKAEGGITFAQDDSAQQPSMPRSAVASGCVDFVLPPAEIARELGRIARHPFVSPQAPAAHRQPRDGPDLSRILELVRRGTGADFRHYKTNTIYRRVTRRMVLLKMEGLAEYTRFLARTPAEVEALYQDILISVTSFFRNPELFEKLKSKFMPTFWKDRSRHEPLRIWTVGCSTGEEAYSLAIACSEFAHDIGSHVPIQVFGTDLNADSVEKARLGVYPKNIEHDVSPERLRRFFVEVDGSYRVARTIRDMCVFARHNVMEDPPFSQMDLISCRNLLIYFEPALQQKILPVLHYALKASGFLVLGSSETIGSFRDLFEVQDGKHKVYSKKAARPHLALVRAAALRRERAAPGMSGAPPQPAPSGATETQREADRILMTKYVPPAVLVNSELEIQQFRGDTGAYLAPMPGKASLNLLKMAREGLLVGLRAAVARAKRQDAAVREEGLRIKSNGGLRTVNLEVLPVRGVSQPAGSLLIVFEDPDLRRGGGKDAAAAAAAAAGGPGTAAAAARGRAAAGSGKGESEREIERLQQELAATREYLQSVIEQQEAANEELQSANEEVQSANEELQSINEELETSKEEIQSSNEELATVNDELQNRNLELDRANDDLVNLLASVQLPIVMLGQDLRVRRFTPAAEAFFNLIPGDVGRRIGDIKLRLDVADLEAQLKEVIATVTAHEREVQDARGRWHLLRIRPYKTQENKIEGAVVVLIDVDNLTRAREYAESIVAAVTESLLVLDAGLCVRTASPSYCETFGVTPADTEGRPFFELGDGEWDTPEMRRLMEEVLPREKRFGDVELTRRFGRGGRKTVTINARRLPHEGGPNPFTLVAIQDVTARKAMEADLRQRVEELAAADRSKNEFLALLAHELRNPLAPLANALALLETRGAGPEARDKARELMGRQVQHLSQMIDDLLDVSRITQGKIRLRRQAVEVATLLAGAVDLVQHQIEARGQQLSLVVPAEPIHVSADATRMEQILGNLLSNATKFTPKGGHIEVTVETVGSEEGGDAEVVVRVRDDGIGIDAAILPHVFDLFIQADRSLERARGGLGIGLTLVRRLVELHSGSVEARSEGPGKGAEFVVRLPALDHLPAATPAGAAAARATGAEAAAPGVVPRRVLVVDDNMDTAESLSMLLRLQGHEVEVAHDGQEAIERANAFLPEVVLLDIGLPGLDGYQVAARLRERRRTAKALIVALTGYGQEEDRRRALRAGFDQHLTKPVPPQAIYELIARANGSE